MSRFIIRTLAFVAAIISCAPLRADDEAAPSSWFATSGLGNVMFKMVVPKWGEKAGKDVLVREAFGVAYEIDEEGELKELWRTKGWHSREVYLSNDGRYLVRMGPWASDQVNHADLAIAFYDRGVLLKEYRVCDLLKDATNKVIYSASHYVWRPEVQGEETGFTREHRVLLPNEAEPPLMFHLVMIDKTAYRFDVATGKVHSTTVDTKAKSSGDLFREARDAEAKEGRALYASSSFKEAYDANFKVEEPIARTKWKTYGVWFEGPEWHAGLKPLKKHSLPASISAAFPIVPAGKIECSIMPTEIDTAILAALQHPFVKQLMADKMAADIHLQITGDRLHWKSEELQKMLSQVLPGDQNAESLRPWAELSFDSVDTVENPLLPPPHNRVHKTTRVFLNIRTGQLIHEDESKWPYQPVLLDAKGERVGKR